LEGVSQSTRSIHVCQTSRLALRFTEYAEFGNMLFIFDPIWKCCDILCCEDRRVLSRRLYKNDRNEGMCVACRSKEPSHSTGTMPGKTCGRDITCRRISASNTCVPRVFLCVRTPSEDVDSEDADRVSKVHKGSSVDESLVNEFSHLMFRPLQLRTSYLLAALVCGGPRDFRSHAFFATTNLYRFNAEPATKPINKILHLTKTSIWQKLSQTSLPSGGTPFSILKRQPYPRYHESEPDKTT
jgi:hypothetical protein